jgi:hypothetical protein
MAEFSRNPTPENQGIFEKAWNNLKATSSAAVNGLCTILGAPQQAEAAVPAIVYPIIANIGIFTAENPDFWNKVVRTGVSLLNLFGLVEQKWTDFVSFGSSKKSKTVVSSSAKASGGGGGGGSSTQPPDGDGGNGSEKRRSGPVTRDQRNESRVKVKKYLTERGFKQKGDKWYDNKGNEYNIDKAHGDHYHRLDPKTGRKLEDIYLPGDARGEK